MTDATYIWTALILGAAGFAHCLGMCGPLAMHVGQGSGGARLFARQFLWHAGKIATYVFLGALAGFAGGFVVTLRAESWIQDVLAWACGGVMILAGLRMLGLRLPHRGEGILPLRPPGVSPAAEKQGGIMQSILNPLLGRSSGASVFVLGMVTGFLPCPIVLGGLAISVQGGSVGMGMAAMAALGIGTMAALLPLGLAGGLLGQVARPRLKRWGGALAGAVLILAGAVTALRATTAFHNLLGCPDNPTTNPASQPSCCGGNP